MFVVLTVASVPGAAWSERGVEGPIVWVPTGWSDGANEHWVIGDETISGQTMEVDVRYRVLPGARLVIEDSTLTFAAGQGGQNGIVTEPGSEVEIRSSVLQAGAPLSFFIHLEGHSLLRDVTIEGAKEVIVQPRSLTDHVDEAVGAQLEGDIPGWRLVRMQTEGEADWLRVAIGAGGPLVAGVPEQYPSVVGGADPVRLTDVSVGVEAGQALECYATMQSPDPDRGPLGVVANNPHTELTVTGGTWTSGTGPLMHCAAVPDGRTLPDRNVPVAGAPAALSALLPPPTRPEVYAGIRALNVNTAALQASDVVFRLDTPLALTATGNSVEGSDLLAHVVDEGSDLALVANQASGLVDGVVAEAGSVSLDGDTLAGTGVGVYVDGASLDVDGATFSGFWTCAHIASTPAVVANAAFDACDTGVLLAETSGVVVDENAFSDNTDPLRVHSPSETRAHFDHVVLDNTVAGRALLYSFDNANPPDFTDPVGHAVIAFTHSLRVTDIALDAGQVHVVSSSDIVLGARPDRTATVLDALAPGASEDYLRVWEKTAFKPYPGAAIGPQGVLDAGYGNDLDASWALADLWRDEGREVRFVEGTMQGETDSFLDWIGMEHAGYAFGMQGIDALWFGPTYQMQRTWLEVETVSGVYVEADPLYRMYDWSEPYDYQDIATIDGEELVATVLDGADLDYTNHGASGFDMQALHALQNDYNATGMAAIDADSDPFDGRDVFRVATPRPFTDSDAVTRTPEARFAEVGEDRMWSTRIVSHDMSDPSQPATAHMDFEATLPDLYGRRISIESYPDTEAMHDAIVAAGGLWEVDPNAYTYTTFLMVDDEVQDFIGGVQTVDGTGATVFELPADPADRPVTYNPGDLVGLKVHVIHPDGYTYGTHDSPFRVGGTYSVVIDVGGSPEALIDRRIAAYQDTLDTWGHADPSTTVAHGDLLAELYYIQGLDYFRKLHDVSGVLAAQNDVFQVPLASVAMTGASVLPVTVAGAPRVSQAPPYFDIRNIDLDTTTTGDIDALLNHRFSAGVIASALEDKVFTEMYDLPAVSTIKALSVAADEGIPIYHINSTQPEALSELNLPATVESSIVAAINRGWDVVVPRDQVTYFNWTGVGWLEWDLATGSAGWLIYGGTAPVTGTYDGEFPILRGGAGAQHTPGSDGKFFDWGYEQQVLTGIDWTDKGVGFISGNVETTFKYQNIYDAGSWGRRQLQGVALNNVQKAQAGNWDIPGKYGKFAGRAGNAVAVVGHAADMWSIANSAQAPETKVAQMAGVTAINVASVAAGGAVIKGFATGGALVGGAVFDGPGFVAGAIIGGALGALSLGVASHYAKKGFLGLF